MVGKLSGGVECMRCFLLFLNILFLIIGIALLGIGIYIKLDTKFASTLSDLADKTGDVSIQSIGFLGYMMIAAGVITILIALFGCVGKSAIDCFQKKRNFNVSCSIYSFRNLVAQSMFIMDLRDYSSNFDDY